ncbi:unnamed protein product [Candidula unifasciata]|uniref:C2H2-type domain-containing protein n=1 Tax=Candidula unifasciata TaxID=100452 RepID=A0A8S3YQC6_9EUPU|nr:unnamed protein product [Candidula unifasciata]
MSHQDRFVSSPEDASTESVIRLQKVNENSAVDAEDSTEDVAYSDKEAFDFDNSSDDSNKRRDNKNGKHSKSKVKIKTLTIDGQLVYFCKICDKVFTRRKDKLNHELAHSGESVLTCTECGKEYLHESSLASHMRTHAGDPLFMCDLCPKMFAQSHHLKTHILSHSEPTNFVCKTCYKEFPTSSDLNHHNRIQSKQEITKFWCKMCKIYFCRIHKLTCESRLHAFCCSACSELFHTHKKLKIHMKKFAHYSLDKPKYIEPLQEHELYPDKVQENLKKLQSQKENDLMRKPIKNDVNGKRLSDSYSDIPFKRFKLSVRKLIIDGDQSSTSVQDSAPEASKEVEIELKSPPRHRKGKPYCKKCNKSFKDSVDLDRHKALVHEDRKDAFKCEICSLEFASSDDLDRHGFKHSRERMHTCPVCGQEFPDSSQLTLHLRIHVGDFPYKCSQCGKSFRLKIQLIQHVRLHIAQDANGADKGGESADVGDEQQDHSQGEVENFKCHLCSRSFMYRYKLLDHMKLHANVKCFQCYICRKMLSTKCNLQRHLQTHIKQGMDVDVHNIIIDGDSKSQLDSVSEQLIRANFQLTEHIQNHQGIEGVEKEDLKQPFFGIQRSVSNFELESRFKDHSNFNVNNIEVQGHSLGIRLADIKADIEDDMDSLSEHSFSSSFTRDSERSDPFKFSSDESDTFKTIMAKERIRLRRRLRKNREFFVHSGLQDLSELKKNDDLNSVVAAEGGGDQEDDVTNMMVELNTVTSELDDVTTVFVNLTDKKMITCEKTISSRITETLLITGSSSVPKIEFCVKKEIHQDYANHELGASENDVKDIVNTHEIGKEATSGKMLMFEFDAEQFLDSHINCHEERTGVTSAKHIDEHFQTEEEIKVTASKPGQAQQGESSLSSSEDLQLPGQRSHLRFIVDDSSLTSESSNLEKLQAVFEHSSKYLPSPLSSRKIPAQCQQDETHMSTKDESTLNNLINSHGLNSCNSHSQEKQQTFIVEDSFDRKITMLPLQISQNSPLVDQTTPQVTAQDMKSNLGLKAEIVHEAKSLEKSECSLASAETSRNELRSKNSAKITKENNFSSYTHRNAGENVTVLKHASDINDHSISTLMTPQPFSVASIIKETPHSLSFSTSSGTDSHSNYNISDLISQPSSHTISNFTSQATSHNSADLLAESQKPAISNNRVKFTGQGNSSFMVQSSYLSSLNLTNQTSDNTGSNLMVQSVHAGSNGTTEPSSNGNFVLISQSTGCTSSPSMVQSAISSSISLVQSGHPSFTSVVQSVHPCSTSLVQSSHTISTPGILTSSPLVHPGFSPVVRPGSTHIIQQDPIQPGHMNSASFTQTSNDTTPKLSAHHSSHPTYTVNTQHGNHISSVPAQMSRSKKSKARAHISSHRTVITSQSSTHQSSSLTPHQQTSHSNFNLTTPLPASLASHMYCNSIIGTSSSEAGYLQPSFNLTSSSDTSMKLNPALGSISTSSDNSTVSYGYLTNQNNPPSLLGGCFISAHPLINPQYAIGLNTHVNPSLSLAGNSDFSLNPSTIFDASNPVYRDMNMMDLICTSSTDCSQAVAGSNIGFVSQGCLEAQMRNDIATPFGIHSGFLQSQNQFFNIGNPTIAASFGISGNPANSLFPQQIIPVPVGFGQLDNQMFTTGLVAGDGTLLNSGNVYGTLPRDVYLNSSNVPVPHFAMQLGQAGGLVPLDFANMLPQNTSGFPDMNSFRSGSIRGSLSMNIADQAGSSFINTGNQSLNQASFSSDFPLSISANPQLINNLSSMGIFPNSGLQSNLSNLIAPSNFNFLNAAMIPQNPGQLPGSSAAFVTDFSTGFFPKF